MANGKNRDPQDRYLHDSLYHATVDSFESLFYEGRYTPNELREAVALAADHFETTRIRRDYVSLQEEREYRWKKDHQPRKYITIDESSGYDHWGMLKKKGGKV
ncbi:MAG TPA: hypothetical protein ENI13_01185 [candidate division CPR3 bacterium]|uniref:Uncharacterized protein n=1 Tax=candidate division CPR3 bacterium TaxID=2268181 RepID=A0A7C1S9A7_UNCC3|nr:hypothetical protein [candidate division CPR3 bacterium]